ncbi:Fis family transcriptional regulator [Burkholderia sp. FERM BP-3421]|uniref:Fis family transcriptional regulator n=1 Tax=Burkholderia sp. FERM BP-3421 TaxID=1494466 RepID=UPI00235EA681|nr:Fis family transcriptional regulator [Burkholderia sp. FERM BP-3421]WDD92106.1 Fis family transcriptional regulator [Burkholderia sp. FERM BP-3421]
MKNWPTRLRKASANQTAMKTELLPLPQPIQDVLSLEYHLHLEALRAGTGSLMALQALMRVAVASRMLEELGYGNSVVRPVDDYENTARDALSAGTEGRYGFNALAVKEFAALVTEHDAQLQMTPVRVIDQVAKRLERKRSAARS